MANVQRLVNLFKRGAPVAQSRAAQTPRQAPPVENNPSNIQEQVRQERVVPNVPFPPRAPAPRQVDHTIEDRKISLPVSAAPEASGYRLVGVPAAPPPPVAPIARPRVVVLQPIVTAVEQQPVVRQSAPQGPARQPLQPVVQQQSAQEPPLVVLPPRPNYAPLSEAEKAKQADLRAKKMHIRENLNYKTGYDDLDMELRATQGMSRDRVNKATDHFLSLARPINEGFESEAVKRQKIIPLQTAMDKEKDAARQELDVVVNWARRQKAQRDAVKEVGYGSVGMDGIVGPEAG